MKRAGGLFLGILLATGVYGQVISRNFGSVVFPGGTSATIPGYRTFGSVVFPGGSPNSPIVPSAQPIPVIPMPNTPLAAPVPAFGGFGVGNSFNRGNSFNNGNSFVRNGGRGRNGRNNFNNNANNFPIVVPIYVGGGGGYGGYYDSPTVPEAPPAVAPWQQPNVNLTYPPQQPIMVPMGPDGPYSPYGPMSYGPMTRQAPPVSQSATAEVEQAQDPHFLIAFKDHTIYTAVAYWFDGDTLHYFTKGDVHNQASVALVDRDLTERLNREMGIDFKMPRAK
jgi:hypothetical protein